ncbi:MAG: hypothetical protein POH28_03725 [Acidocella sp.]|nr:hypothetical protein [Acidocella sp.]
MIGSRSDSIKDHPGLAVRCAAAISPAVIFGAERGNIDLFIFALMVLGVAACCRQPPALRLAGYLLVTAAAMLKFYPAAALVLVLREKLRLMLVCAATLAILACLYLVLYAGGTVTAIRTLPGGPPFGYWFGASNAAIGTALLLLSPGINLDPDIAAYRAVLDSGRVFQMAKTGIFIMEIAALALAIRIAARRPYAEPASAQHAFMLAGAAILCVCFFAAQNVVYREVYALMILPALSGQRHWLEAGIIALLWEEALRRVVASFATGLFGISHGAWIEIGFWVLRETLWWWVIIELGAILVSFMRRRAVELSAAA